ncbi:hypothetical protein KC323_g85 [Hortaea werneckii]|nr:hypothetical protein KC323_g85 [Hortaea werneckii]
MIFAIVPWVVWPLSTTLKMILSFGALDLHPTTTSGSLSALDFGIHAREQAESLSTLPRTVRRYVGIGARIASALTSCKALRPPRASTWPASLRPPVEDAGL